MRRIGMLAIVFGLILAAGLGSGCNSSSKKKTEGVKVEVLATVGSLKITTEDFQNALSSLPEDYKVLAESEKGKHKILDNLIKKDLLVLEAETRSYQNDPTVKAKIKEVKDKSRDRMLKQIEELQDRLANVDRQVYENVMLGELNDHLKKEGLKDVTISDFEIESYYQDYARKMKILNPSAKVPDLAAVKGQIGAILVEEQLIKQLQKKSAVEVKEDVFQKLYGQASGALIEDASHH
jgi:hypothetical protein